MQRPFGRLWQNRVGPHRALTERAVSTVVALRGIADEQLAAALPALHGLVGQRPALAPEPCRTRCQIPSHQARRLQLLPKVGGHDRHRGEVHQDVRDPVNPAAQRGLQAGAGVAYGGLQFCLQAGEGTKLPREKGQSEASSPPGRFRRWQRRQSTLIVCSSATTSTSIPRRVSASRWPEGSGVPGRCSTTGCAHA